MGETRLAIGCEIRWVHGDRARDVVLGVVRPPETECHLAIIYIHGKGDNFYGLPFSRVVPHMLGRSEALHISLNMTCHDLGYTRTDIPSTDSVAGVSPEVAGGMWEDLEEGKYDIKAAVREARKEGATRIVLVGHSSGGFYAADYAATYGSIDGLFLLSPLTANQTTVKKWFETEAELASALALAEEMVKSGRGRELLPLSYWYYGISAESFLQRMAEAPGVFVNNLVEANVPTFVVWGSLESRGSLFRSIVDNLAIDESEGLALDGVEHNYIGAGAELANLLRRFLGRLSGR